MIAGNRLSGKSMVFPQKRGIVKFITDFHIHSHFSIATSRRLIPEYLELWARIKGINVLGTGDCIHPGWLKELRDKLEPAGNGFYRLKDQYRLPESKALASSILPGDIYFMLTGEVSSIYKKDGRVRKVHNVCVFSDFDSAMAVQARLDKLGNITSDGRPILGLDSKTLLDMVLNASQTSFLIPAHIWTPWFSVLGSKSGFDRLEECYEDLTGNIFAVETGLSSDPAMNWTCSFLDRFKLVSNSDAHSPDKLGREANLFDCEQSYRGVYDALRGDSGFEGTIEFYPQEGKYHYDGHRKCGICWDPLETIKHRGMCPVCGREVTKGVLYRMAELADRTDISTASEKRMYYSITQLSDLIAEIRNVKSSGAQAVQREYFNLIRSTGSEFYCLLFADIEEIRENSSDLMAEGIARIRRGEVIIEEGFDGEFGRIRVFRKGENEMFEGRGLFPANPPDRAGKAEAYPDQWSVKFDISAFKAFAPLKDISENVPEADGKKYEKKPADSFTEEQLMGIRHGSGPCMVIAGPGSGKTRILTERISRLIENGEARPENILAITFTNNAAREIRERLRKSLDPPYPEIMTFHSLGLSILKEHCSRFNRYTGFDVIDGKETEKIINTICGNKRESGKILSGISRYKQGIADDIDAAGTLDEYEKELVKRNSFDLDDLIYLPVLLLSDDEDICAEYRNRYQWLLIDEYQDINRRQYQMVRLLTQGENPNIFVIGDPDQAIYGFRGSDIRFIHSFSEDFPSSQTLRLSRSFRCPDTVLMAASQAIGSKRVMTGGREGIKILIQSAPTEKSEAEWIASTIEAMIGGVRSFSMDSGVSDGYSVDRDSGFSDFAVLCRSSLLFEPIVEAFGNHGIPCQIIGPDPFYYNEPYYGAIQLLHHAYYKNAGNDFPDEMVKELSMMIDNENDMLTVAETALRRRDASSEEIKKFNRFCGRYESYAELFQSLAVRNGVDDLDITADAVFIMTIHAAKGLEFNHVFIPGCEEGIIPFTIFGGREQEEFHEEERLFYVGATRTKRNLFLSHAHVRHLKGRVLKQPATGFLKKIELDLLNFNERIFIKKEDEQQLELF